jgi:hypothetical protein
MTVDLRLVLPRGITLLITIPQVAVGHFAGGIAQIVRRWIGSLHHPELVFGALAGA